MKWIKNLFKKKKDNVIPPKPKKMDFSNYKMKLTIKSICMFEKMSGKSFFKIGDEDIPMLIYCTFYCSNTMDIKFETFIGIMANEQVADWVVEQYGNILDVMKQFPRKEEEVNTNISGDTEPTMTDMANSLIINYGVDANYVMTQMETWEIESMFEMAESKVKNHYEEERLWTYLSIMPHIDGKKVKGPDKLLPFPWEKEEHKKKVDEDLKNNLYAARHTIGMSINDILNGTGQSNNNT